MGFFVGGCELLEYTFGFRWYSPNISKKTFNQALTGNIGAVPTEAKSVFQHFATTNKKAHPSPLAMALAFEKNVQEPSKVASSGRGQTFDRIHIQ